eukprot:1158431-Pelagomonas_calceolata.AAC.7
MCKGVTETIAARKKGSFSGLAGCGWLRTQGRRAHTAWLQAAWLQETKLCKPAAGLLTGCTGFI